MKTYKLKSSAVRAAKKEMGDNWMDFATIESQGEEFIIQLKATNQIAPQPSPALAKSIQLAQVLADQEEAEKEMAAKKAEIESRKPVHIPKLPSAVIVASESTPKSTPALPAFLKIAPPKEEEVPDLAPPPAEVIVDMSQPITHAQSDDELTSIQKTADKIADAHAVNLDPLKPRVSTTDLPTKKVWHIADEMMAAAKKAGTAAPKRKEVIEECVRRGVAYGTARTQYQHWFKTMNDSACAPIATIGKDGKVVMPK